MAKCGQDHFYLYLVKGPHWLEVTTTNGRSVSNGEVVFSDTAPEGQPHPLPPECSV